MPRARTHTGLPSLVAAIAIAISSGSGCYGPLEETAGAACTDYDWGFRCAYQSEELVSDDPARLVHRTVHWAEPSGEPPPDGWPTVVAFQGSGFPAELYFTADPNIPFGGEHQGATVRALLEAGFAVLAPEAQGNGYQYWDTNLVHRAWNWEATADHALMLELLARVDEGKLGAFDPQRLFAMGVSSGGYMTSRMAVSYPGRFSALAIAAASYATCGGAYCVVPDELPADHPPTLFLHGHLDVTVPERTMRLYADALEEDGVEVSVRVHDGTGHGWTPEAPEAVPAFFAR